MAGVEERSARRADASDEPEALHVPRAGRAAAEHGVAAPSGHRDTDELYFGARSVKMAHSDGAPARIGTDDDPMPQLT